MFFMIIRKSSFIVFVSLLILFFDYSVVDVHAQRPNENVNKESIGKEVTTFLNDSVQQTQQQLLLDFKKNDPYLLLGFKKTVDALISGISAVQVIGSDHPYNFLQSMTYDYSQNEVRCKMPDNNRDVERFFQIANNNSLKKRKVSFDFIYHSVDSVGLNYPVWISGRATVNENSAVVIFDWYEPCLAHRYIAFPINPRKLYLEWDRNGYKIGVYGRKLEQKMFENSPPVFNNHHQLYGLYDAIKIAVVPLRFTTQRTEETLPEITVVKNDTPRRKISFSFDEHTSDLSVFVEQKAFFIPYKSHNVYSFSKTLPEKVKTEKYDYTPNYDLCLYPNGFNSKIDFSGLQPKRLSITYGGVIAHSMSYDNFDFSDSQKLNTGYYLEMDSLVKAAFSKIRTVYGNAPNWKPEYYSFESLQNESDQTVLRTMIKYNIYAAVRETNRQMLKKNLSFYRDMLYKQNIPFDMFIYSLEEIIQTTFDFRDKSLAMEIMEKHLISAYRTLPFKQLNETLGRLAKQLRFAFAVLAIDVMQEKFPQEYADQYGQIDFINRLKALSDSIDPKSLSIDYPDSKRIFKLNNYFFQHSYKRIK